MAVFVIADLHFGDERLCLPASGSGRQSARPFRGAGEMRDEIVRRWNAIVGTRDVVYVLGDVGKPDHVAGVAGLCGEKHLVAGNGDDLGFLAGSGLFASIAVARWLPGALLTHIPVHPSQLRSTTINLHGHLHARALGDRRYRCVSVEQTGYVPVPLVSILPEPIQRSLF